MRRQIHQLKNRQTRLTEKGKLKKKGGGFISLILTGKLI